jgi:hypothetical protein
MSSPSGQRIVSAVSLWKPTWLGFKEWRKEDRGERVKRLAREAVEAG